MHTTNLPPWDQLSFSFGWDNNITTTIPQCMDVTFQYYQSTPGGLTPNPPPTPPYEVVMYGGGFEPYSIPINNSAQTGKFRWTANLPLGPKFAVSMKDSKGYTGGILSYPFHMTPGSGCNLANPLKNSSLDVAVTGTSQCGRAIVEVNNGAAPYTLEVVPLDDRQQKTIHFASSPFTVVLDMSEGVEYFLAIYDSGGNSAVMGSYNITSSSDNSCLGTATTVTAGKFSTLYPGGTALPTSTSSAEPDATSDKSGGLTSRAIIGIAVSIPAVIVITGILVWLCYKRKRRQHKLDSVQKLGSSSPEVDHSDYTPVGASYQLNVPSHSNHELSSTSHPQNPSAPIPYVLHSTATGRQVAHIEGTSANESLNGSLMDKRRHIVNPDLHNLGPIDAEPFDPSTLVGSPLGSESQPGLPPLPPPYSRS